MSADGTPMKPGDLGVTCNFLTDLSYNGRHLEIKEGPRDFVGRTQGGFRKYHGYLVYLFGHPSPSTSGYWAIEFNHVKKLPPYEEEEEEEEETCDVIREL